MPVLALGGIGIVLAALMAALIIWGALQIGKAIASVIPNWHVPFLGSLRDAAFAGINAGLSIITGWLRSALSPIGKLFAYPVIAAENIVARIQHTFESVYNQLWQIRRVVIPLTVRYLIGIAEQIYNKAIAYTVAKYFQALDYAQRIYNAAIKYTVAKYFQAIDYANHIYNAAVAYTVAKYFQAISYANHIYNVAVAYTVAKYFQAIDYANHVYNVSVAYTATKYLQAIAEAHRLYDASIAQAQRYATAARNEAITTVNTTVAVADAAVWPKLIDEVQALQGVIATDLPALGALVRAIPRAIPRDLAESVAASAAVDIAITRFLRDCGVPNCKGIGGLAKELPKLLEVVEGAAFLAFIVAMIEAPQATANETVTVLDPITRTVGQTLVSAAGGL